jgi:hypothetical protein
VAKGACERKGTSLKHRPPQRSEPSLEAGLRARKPTGRRKPLGRSRRLPMARGPQWRGDVSSLAYRCGGSTGFRAWPDTSFPFQPAEGESRRAPRTSGGDSSWEASGPEPGREWVAGVVAHLARAWCVVPTRRVQSASRTRSRPRICPTDQADGVCRASRKYIDITPLILDRARFSKL